jgi:hypothetical protein
MADDYEILPSQTYRDKDGRIYVIETIQEYYLVKDQGGTEIKVPGLKRMYEGADQNPVSSISPDCKYVSLIQPDGTAVALRKEVPSPDRDMEWWEELCLVDSVAPNPGAVKKWVLDLQAYFNGKMEKEHKEMRKMLQDTADYLDKDNASLFTNCIGHQQIKELLKRIPV